MYWKAHPVNLAPMAADVAKLRKDFDAAIQQRTMTNAAVVETNDAVVTNATAKNALTNVDEKTPVPVIAKVETHGGQPEFNLWPFVGAGVLMCVIAVIILGRQKRKRR